MNAKDPSRSRRTRTLLGLILAYGLALHGIIAALAASTHLSQSYQLGAHALCLPEEGPSSEPGHHKQTHAGVMWILACGFAPLTIQPAPIITSLRVTIAHGV